MAYTFTRTGAQIEEIHNTVDDLPNIVSNGNLIANASFDIAGSVTNPPDATPRSYSAGDELFLGFKAVGALSGVTYINGKLNGTGQLYVDIYKTEKQKLSTALYAASIASSDGVAVESGASFVDNDDYWRVTFDMNDTFSVKLEQGSVATGHETDSLSVRNFSDFGAVVYKNTLEGSAVENMVNGSVVVGGTCITEGTIWRRVLQSIPSVITDFKPLNEIYVEAFGVREGVNSGQYHNKAADYARENGGAITSLPNKIYTTDETVNFRSIRNLNYKSQLSGTGEFVTMLLGGDSNEVQQYYTQTVYKVNRGGAAAAIRLVGSNKNEINIGEASIFEMYADTQLSLNGTDRYCAYNKVNIKSCGTFLVNSNPNTDGTIVQWVNENQVNLQFCQYLRFVDNGYLYNGNRFNGGNFEAADSTIIIEAGRNNIFEGVRGEDALHVTFGEFAENNTVITTWFGFRNAPDAGVVTDNGANNVVKNFNDISNDRITLMSFNGSSLKHDSSGNANLLGVASSSVITPDPVNNIVTTATFQTFYTSPLLEVFINEQYFDVEVVPKLSGGIKMQINGWDSDMVPIASTGSDVFYQGATNEIAGFGEESTTITNSAGQRRVEVRNPDAKYIEILVKGSSSGCQFRRFTLEMVSSAVDGKKVAMASAMIPNRQ